MIREHKIHANRFQQSHLQMAAMDGHLLSRLLPISGTPLTAQCQRQRPQMNPMWRRQHITTYHNISQHTAQTTSGTRSMEGEIQVMNNDNLHILIAPICTGLCEWLPSNNSSEKRMLKRSSLATCRAFCTLSQFAPAPQELEGKTLRLLPVCRFLGKNFAPQILTCAVYVLESFGCECCVNGVVGVLGS